MGLRSRIKKLLNKLLSRIGFEIIPKAYVYDWQQGSHQFVSTKKDIPENAREYLKPENPALQELTERYRNSAYPECEELIWTDERIPPEDILYFRGHNAFLYQDGRFNRNVIGYLLAYYYIKSIDSKGLLDRLNEDGAFGAITYNVDGRLVSRDMLDSILEIYFLERHIGLFQKPKFSVLDIGAGYGRLAYRMVQAFQNLEHYLCADAIAVSSFIADYYLQFRDVSDRARVVALDKIDAELNEVSLDLAVNIHSFSECSLKAIDWWMSLIHDNQIPYLLIVPNSKNDLLTVNRESFSHLVNKYGYQLVVREPRYPDPIVQRYALNPDYFHLYRFRA